jgi:hypothetical protein
VKIRVGFGTDEPRFPQRKIEVLLDENHGDAKAQNEKRSEKEKMADPWKNAFQSRAVSKDIKNQPSPSLLPLTPFPFTSSVTPESVPTAKTIDDKKKGHSQKGIEKYLLTGEGISIPLFLE